jgi:hypothetical protein
MFIRSSPDEIIWTSHSGFLYDLQYTTNLSAPAWATLATNVLGNGTINSMADPFRHTIQPVFYRVQTSQ